MSFKAIVFLQNGRTALIEADHTEIVKTLLEAKADPNITDKVKISTLLLLLVCRIIL